MKTTTKVWLITAATLILVGLIIFGGAMMALKWDFSKLSNVKYETNEYEITESYKNISVITNTANITFLPTEEMSSKVICYEQENLKHSVEVKNDTLTIEIADTRKWYEHIDISLKIPKITVFLPEGVYGAITGNAITGNIDISDIAAASLDFSVTTGNITASSVKCDDSIMAKVTTGQVILSNVTCNSLSTTGTTGKIKLTNVYAAGAMSIERTTGDVIFNNSDAASICVKVITGDVRGTLHSPKTFYTATTTGKVSVPKTNGGKCEITTTTGDIIIELATY